MAETVTTPTVKLPRSRGEIRGTVVKDVRSGNPLTFKYAGVPYALPPTGDRRWKKPVPLPDNFEYGSNSKIYDKAPGLCHQPTNYRTPYSPPSQLSQTEDCLYLSIWTPLEGPTKRPSKGWPVLLYIHGGWLQVGSPLADPLEDPSELIAKAAANKPFIVVAPGYRLNVFGFMAHEELMKEEGQGTSGNYGFWDQRLTLEWIYENIASFGGDPSQITAWGLSAGAHSVHSQLLHEYDLSKASNGAYKPIIRRAFLQSNANVLPAKHISEVNGQLDELYDLVFPTATNVSEAAISDAEKIEALRGVSAEKLVEAIPKMHLHTFRATYHDGPGGFVSKDWIKAMRSGGFAAWCREHDIAFIIGETANENTLYEIVNSPRIDPKGTKTTLDAELERQVHNYYPLHVARALIAAYPLATKNSALSLSEEQKYARVFGHITSDSQVFAAERLLVRDLVTTTLSQDATKKPVTVLRYRIDFRADVFSRNSVPEEMGVSHGFDNPLWFFHERYGSWPQGKGDALRAALLSWLAPFVDFINGVPPEQVSKAWYADADASSFKHPIRVLSKDGKTLVEEDPRWEEKSHVMQVMDEARQQG